jgi:hypothetical protein
MALLFFLLTMPRPRNKLKTEQITLTVNSILCGQLDKVVLTGHYGNGRAEAAERLITEAIRQLIREGTIVRKKNLLNL